MAKNKNYQQSKPIVNPVEESYSGPPEEFEKESAPNIVIDKEDLEQDTNWLDISTAHKDGTSFMLAENLTDEGVFGYWKKTRKIVKMRWHVSGKWVNGATNMDIGFVPKYWRMR